MPFCTTVTELTGWATGAKWGRIERHIISNLKCLNQRGYEIITTPIIDPYLMELAATNYIIMDILKTK